MTHGEKTCTIRAGQLYQTDGVCYFVRTNTCLDREDCAMGSSVFDGHHWVLKSNSLRTSLPCYQWWPLKLVTICWGFCILFHPLPLHLTGAPLVFPKAMYQHSISNVIMWRVKLVIAHFVHIPIIPSSSHSLSKHFCISMKTMYVSCRIYFLLSMTDWWSSFLTAILHFTVREN